MSDQVISYYGIHKHQGVAYLHQGRGSSNFVGLKQKSPYVVENPYGVKFCNHNIPTAAPLPDRVHWDFFLNILKDPLVQVLLPLPRPEGKRLYYIDDPQDDLSLYLVLLSKLSSPINKIVQPIWTFKTEKLQQEMSQSNIQPLILTQTTVKQQKVVDQVSKLSAYEPRTVVITGDPDVIATKPCVRIATRIRDFPLEDLAQVAMEGLGAAVIRRYCRNEKIDAPMEDRETRRERMIAERKLTQ